MTSAPDFDWSGEDRENIIVKEQAAIACYANPHGHVVIRQEGHYGPEEDMWVVVAPHNVATLANALLRMVPVTEAHAPPSARERKKANGSGSDAEPLLIPYSGKPETLPLG